MIKKIPVEQMKAGMYVSGIISSAPVREAISNGLISDQSTIDELRSIDGLQLLIDTDKGVDVEGEDGASAAGPVMSMLPGHSADFVEELRIAQKSHEKALSLISNVFKNVKNGGAINTAGVEDVVDSLMASVFRNQSALACLGLIRQKDNYLMEHSVNLCVLMGIFGKYMEFDPAEIRQMAIGAMLHDIGKTKVPDHILHKPAKLTEEEFAVMKKHPVDSRAILQKTPGISQIAIDIAVQHHEKVGGGGYPEGLSRDQISVYGRMLAIVDVYDAISADRCYHNRLTPSDALKRLLQMTGEHLDEALTHKFIKSIGVYPVGTVVCMESGKMGVVMDSRVDNLLKPLIRTFYHYKNKQFLPVEDIDLAHQRVTDRIVKTEDPRNFNIDAHKYLATGVA